MPASLNKYLDPAALDETVVNIRELIEGLEAEMQDLPYARPDGLYPDMTVGAVIGADETAQWAQRESTGTGSATVRSVQGAAEVQDGELVPVRIAGISSTDAQGGELDSIEWTAQTLRAAGSVADMLYSDHVDVRVGVVAMNAVTWQMNTAGIFFLDGTNLPTLRGGNTGIALSCSAYTPISSVSGAGTMASAADMTIATGSITSPRIYVKDTRYATVAEFNAATTDALIFYPLATPTTTPISPALNMTYRVQTGGSESIIVPDGEISAAPVLTVAEPVNAGDEFARIWEAIQSLGYTRNTAQLSRPVSLTVIGSIDEAQKDTTEIDTTEIDTTKEVTE